MFAQPRPKKSLLPPPIKRRKTEHAVEEITFDNDARQEYLTGFHKRKLQRAKRAREEAELRAKEEKRELRKQMREEKLRSVEEHVQMVNQMLRESEAAGAIDDGSDSDGSEWGGIEDPPETDIIDHEDEYIDEDRYTTVKVESVSVTRDGLEKSKLESSDDEDEKPPKEDETKTKEKKRPPKKPKQKFRYESKVDRRISQQKIKAKKMSSRAKRQE